jgi:tryptophan-rich sensory protein
MGALLVFLLLVAAAAAAGGHFLPGAWYASLVKPAWTPPNWIFGPVWTLLYIGIAVAGWLVWRRSGPRVGPSLALWGAQLVLNAAWSWFFFGRHQPGVALADIAALLACIVAFVIVTYRDSRPAALLFVPYALWVAFATALNHALWRLNLS